MKKVFLFLCLGFCSCVFASSIHVLTLDESRIGTSSNVNGSLNLNFVVGDGFASLRTALLNTSNFGNGGLVGRAVNFVPTVSEISLSSLTGVDVVILNKPTNLSVAEKAAIATFVQQGGGLFVFHNSAALDFSSLVGANAGNFSPSGQTVTSGNVSSASQGPFGTVGQGVGNGAGFAGSFSSLGPHGQAVLNNDQGVLGALFQVSAGRAGIFADEEIFLSRGVPGIAAAHLTSLTQTIFLNTFAHITPDENFSFAVPEAQSLLLLCLSLLFVRRAANKK